jgi:N-acetylornithine carbamoyltransferase
LDKRYLSSAQQFCSDNGKSFDVSYDIDSAYKGANIVYAKSWGSLNYYGNPEAEMLMRKDYKHFIVDDKKMNLTKDGVFSHCLPLRRNIKATDSVMDSPSCLAIQEAENRKHVQKSVLSKILGGKL